MYKIVHLREECISCGLCNTYAPNFWEINCGDSKADLKNSKKENNNFILEISEEVLEQNKIAAQSCPMSIIHIYDDKGEDVTLK